MRTRLHIKKLVVSALLVAVGIGLQIAESMIPMPINLPGGKLGLANIVTVILLYTFDIKTAFICALMRAFLGSLLYGGVSGMLYSVSGAVFSALIMWAAMRLGHGALTEIGVSVIGAASHNAAQVSVACIMLSNVWIYTYLPILGTASCITGIFTGYAARFAVKHMRKTGICEKMNLL